MDSEGHQDAFDAAFNLVVNIWPVPERHNRQNREIWPMQQQIVPHIERLAEYYRVFQGDDEDEGWESPSQKPLIASREFAELLYKGGW